VDHISIRRFTDADLRRIHRLKNKILDLDVAIDDLDRELAPRLAERAHLVALLDEAQTELQMLLERAA
jgi:hypothetical protein